MSYRMANKLSKEEIQELSDALVEGVKAKDKNFWISAEEHYLDHKDWSDFKKVIGAEGVYDLKQLLETYRLARSLWIKAFIGLAIVGTIAAAGYGILSKVKGG